VQFTVGRETHENLRRAQDLLRREIPDGDPGQIFDRALKLLLEDIARKKLAATSKARAKRRTAEGSRHIPAHAKRAVWLRDGGQCAFVARSGRRCRERALLEFHHVDPYAIGGEATVANLSLRCRAHNIHEAERLFRPFAPVVRGGIWHSLEPDDRATRPGAS
jgi:5-methylcytosine-specific restriction endonuclease McrA